PLPEAPAELAYVIVNEAGASDYSTSPLGREEFPNFDATLRSTVSIGRRLQDPLSELVKIDPQHVGVGLYQHDVHPKHLKDPLDGTWIHPESYPVARQLLHDLGFEPEVLRQLGPEHPLRERLKGLAPPEVAQRLNVGEPTVRDILDALARPGRDPREDLPPPVFKKGVLKLEDLNPGMELKGTVLNVVPFGAFVDIGLKDSGLVHISQMANRYIKSPHEVVAVGDVVTVWVLNVDAER